MNPSIPILMYHLVSPQTPPGFQKYNVTPMKFARQMSYLARSGYESIGLDALLHRQEHGQMPSRPVIITFDDGFRDCVDYALPILLESHFTAVFYLVAGLIGETSRWLRAERNLELPLMDRQDVEQLITAGIQVGAHSRTHPRLTQLSASDCRTELHLARQILEDRLGQTIQHLAYPFGAFDERVRALAAEAGYCTACTVQPGLVASSDDLLTLRRVHVTGEDSLFQFAWRLRTGMTFRNWIRKKSVTFKRRQEMMPI